MLTRQLRRPEPGNITLSKVTDAFQPLEKKYGITRACLEALVGHDFHVSILTRSPLVLCDLDLIKLRSPKASVTARSRSDSMRAFRPCAPRRAATPPAADRRERPGR